MSAAFFFWSAISCSFLKTMWPLALFPDCLIASFRSDYCHWHVHHLLYILFFLLLYHFFFYHTSVSIIYSLYSILPPLCQLSPLWFPIMSSPPWSFILSSSNSLCCLSVYALIPRHLRFSPSSSHAFHPSLSLSPLYVPLVFSSPSLFPVSVEPLWLHRYSDCWLCRGGGMLFRHSTRRYCTTCTLPHTTKTTAPNIRCTGSILYWGYLKLSSIKSWLALGLV